MKVTLSTDAPTAVRADLLAVGVRSGSPSPIVRAIDQATKGALRAQMQLEEFEGKSGQCLKAAVHGIGAKQVLLVGLGEGGPSDARSIAARAGQLGQSYK